MPTNVYEFLNTQFLKPKISLPLTLQCLENTVIYRLKTYLNETSTFQKEFNFPVLFVAFPFNFIPKL